MRIKGSPINLWGVIATALLFGLFIFQVKPLLSRVKPTSQGEDRIQLRWFVGLGIGATQGQIDTLEKAAADFNASQDEVELALEVATSFGAYDMIATQISSGSGPDIVGPVDWGTASGFPNQWLILDPYISASGFDTGIYRPELLEFYRVEEGTLSLPFGVFPSAIYFVPAMFDEINLAYPPQHYGEKYVLNSRETDWNWETLTQVARFLTIDVNNTNATQPQFDRTNLAQIGFYPQGQDAISLATFFGGAKIYQGERKGSYTSTIPDHWKAAWQWWYDGIWGEIPFMAYGNLINSDEFGSGNVFNAGRAAMVLSQSSLTCCLAGLLESGVGFQLGILPMSEDGLVHGRTAETSFYIWKGTAYPKEAFEVLEYLITTGSELLLPAYTAMPALSEKTREFIAQMASTYPGVTPESWDVLVQGLDYPDRPSVDQYLPNRNEAINRFQIFGDMLINTKDLRLGDEIQKLQDDLTVIYNK